VVVVGPSVAAWGCAVGVASSSHRASRRWIFRDRAISRFPDFGAAKGKKKQKKENNNNNKIDINKSMINNDYNDPAEYLVKAEQAKGVQDNLLGP